MALRLRLARVHRSRHPTGVRGAVRPGPASRALVVVLRPCGG
jgi:hypothetical protein